MKITYLLPSAWRSRHLACFPMLLALLAGLQTLLAGAPVHAAGAAYVWWEGESAFETNFNRGAFAAKSLDRPEELSGGDWLDNGGKAPAGGFFAKWKVTVPADGKYQFYVRKFWHHGPFQWRFGAADWRASGKPGLLDNVELKKFTNANWISLGDVELKAGEQVFEARLDAKEGEDVAAGFDCFLLTQGPFTPSGKLKPGEKLGKAMPGFFAFEPDTDAFQDSPLDLRRLNDKTAGDRGFLSKKGLDLVFEKGTKAERFWAVNAGPNIVSMDHASVDYLARNLAKHGVNMVRLHGAVYDRTAADPASVDKAYLDQVHYFVAAMKREGIYSYISFYFPLWFQAKDSQGLPGFDQLEGNKEKHPFALLYFHPRFQEIYRSWAKGLLTTQNPYTKLSLAEDPAVGLVEVNNEDNYFFHTFAPGKMIPYESLAVLEKKYGDWAAKKYGSVQKALDAWKMPDGRDAVAEGRLGFLQPYAMTAAGVKQNPTWRPRASDQVRFLTEDLRAFYETTEKWFRAELGVKCPVVATNWITADGATLGALDKYTNMACDVLDRHEYHDAFDETDRSYTVTKGDKYIDEDFLHKPDTMREMQYDGFPCTVTEFAYPMPNRFRGDAPFLAAVYGAQQGIDGVFFFALSGGNWQNQLDKWSLQCPETLGQFPATALLYRRGDVAEAPTVIQQVLSLEKLYNLEGSGSDDPQSIDAIRAAEVPAGGQATGKTVSNIDPFAYYVGRVVRSFGEDQSKSVLTDLSKYIDRDAKTIRGFSGETLWNYDKGLVTVNSARAQGATGFLKAAGAIDLKDVTITSGNEYGCVLVVSLDDKPLANSSKILVQCMTEEQPYGWKTAPAKTKKGQDAQEIADLGSPPLNVRNIAGEVVFKAGASQGAAIVALDPAGYPVQRPAKPAAEPKVTEGTALRLTLEPDVMYYVIQR